MFDHIWNNFFWPQSVKCQRNTRKYQRKLENVDKKTEFQFLLEKCHLWLAAVALFCKAAQSPNICCSKSDSVATKMGTAVHQLPSLVHVTVSFDFVESYCSSEAYPICDHWSLAKNTVDLALHLFFSIAIWAWCNCSTFFSHHYFTFKHNSTYNC